MSSVKPVETLTNPWLFNSKPALVAHRGYAQLYPENTLIALAAAVEAGAGFVEFDIQLSKDGVPFLMHDANLQRTAGVDVCVFEQTHKQLCAYSVGEPARLGGRFQNVSPISLEQACVHLNAWPTVHSFIEIKRQSVEHFGLDKVMHEVFQAVRALSAPFTLLSFMEDVVDYTQAHSSHGTGWVIRDWNNDSLATLAKLNPDFVYCNYTKLPANDALPDGDWSWVFYEVTDLATAAELRARGADMIESMTVRKLLRGELFATT